MNWNKSQKGLFAHFISGFDKILSKIEMETYFAFD